MSTYTYKVSYLNDPYQQFLLKKNQKLNTQPSKTKEDNINNKANHRVTELYLNVNDLSYLKDGIETISEKDELGLSEKENNDTNILSSIPTTMATRSFYPPDQSHDTMTNKNLKTNQPTLTTLSHSTTTPGVKKERETLTIDTQLKSNKHSSFLTPLLEINFDVGGLFESEKKDGSGGGSSSEFEDIFKKFSSLEEEEEVKEKEEDKEKENNKRSSQGNLKSQGTIRLNHNTSVNSTTNHSSLDSQDTSTIKRNRRSEDTIKFINSSQSISLGNDKRDSSDTVKLLNTTTTTPTTTPTINDLNENVNEFENKMIENLSVNPQIVIDSTFLLDKNDEEEKGHDGVSPNFYHDDDKVTEYNSSASFNWDEPWKKSMKKGNGGENGSMKSSQSKLSTFSHFTFQSTKKLGKATKSLYKRFIKRRNSNASNSQFPASPIDIPESYNEKERAFEEMMLRNDTINITLSNPNNYLTSSFADETFPLEEEDNFQDESFDEDRIPKVYETDDQINEYSLDYSNSFVSDHDLENISMVLEKDKNEIGQEGDDDLILKKKKNRRRHAGINFEEALPEGNSFRLSLANM